MAVTSAVAASKHILDIHDVEKTNFVLLTENKEDKDQWNKDFEEILKNEEAVCPAFNFHSDCSENVEKCKEHLRKSNLMILPFKSSSPFFASEALSAIAAGVPILVSNHAGIVSLLDVCQEECDIRESTLDSDTEKWKEGIVQKLQRPEDSQRKADRMREQLLLDTSIAETHLDFIRTVVGKILHFYVCI